jgi:hypothetical protein
MSNGNGTSYSVVIDIDSQSVTTLLQNGYWLYAFQGADGPADGVPVVWFNTQAISAVNTITWEEYYSGYTSTTTNLAPGTQIVATFSAPMSLGQEMSVAAGGIGTVTNTGTPGYLEVLNTTNTPYTCGVSVLNPSTNLSNPIAAFPLFGQGLDSFVPVEYCFFMFATQAVNTGSVVEQSFAPGILINMTGQTAPVTVSFDINNGWSGPGNTTNYPANASLQMLINPGGASAASVRAAQRALRSRPRGRLAR